MEHYARPHLSVHSRSQKHSSVAGAAYRLGLNLFDERTQKWHDYTRRKAGEEVVRALTIAPPGAPVWASDPARLWNAVERMERRKDSQVARDYRIPLPRGLNDEQAGDMAVLMARFIVDELHVPVSMGLHRDAAVDAFGKAKPPGEQGYHAHLYFPTRIFVLQDGDATEGDGEGGGEFGPKLRQFVNQASGAAMIERLNSKWAELANFIAGAQGLPAAYDHRSYKRQGLSRRPEPKLGQASTALERRGVQTERGNQLRAHRLRDHRTVVVASVPGSVTADPYQPSVFDAPSPVTDIPQIVLPNARPSLPTRPPEGWRRAIVTPLTHSMRLESPTAYEPPPIAGLAKRFEEANWSAAKGRVSPNGTIVALVRAIEQALNALVTVARGLMHMKVEQKSYVSKLLEVRHETDLQREHRDRLRREGAAARRPTSPRLSATHRKRLAEIATIGEELADKQRIAASLETQLSALGQRMDPWCKQAIHDRQLVKRRIGELLAEGPEHIEQLLEVANEDERPWLALYSARKEPSVTLQQIVNNEESKETRIGHAPQRTSRPSM
jgi:hypothetical protein